MESRDRVLRKEQKIPSGYEPSNCVVRRLLATTADNEQVPITRSPATLRSTARRRCFRLRRHSFVPDNGLTRTRARSSIAASSTIAHIRGGPEKAMWRNAGGGRTR
jgi:oligopeptidase B